MDAHFDAYFDVFLSKITGCHNSPQKRPPELIFGAKFTARRAESEFDSFEAVFCRLVFFSVPRRFSDVSLQFWADKIFGDFPS